MSPLRTLSCSLVLLSLLAGCQSLGGPSSPAAEHIAWERTPQGCSGQDCPLVNVDTLAFADQPALNQLIDLRLRQMTVFTPDDQVPASLADYRDDFLAKAEPGWSSYLQAKVRQSHDDLVVIELSSYLFTGGAHGMPGRAFINYDLRQQRQLELADMLLPGQARAFWDKAADAHWKWLAANGFARDDDFLASWPFQRTDHVALLKEGVLLKYDVYAIAPYSSGHPELLIPYGQLEGIIKQR
ncbi:RsiV family protein [Stutzerimonas kirkiae]|uniref:DUF3298 domain-containing protein n=1 Tax=Stutzerimonas kirkiae TaxID=2211392 RepID=A0A4Q9R130_9GAMM|nr:RsiV family protein [Stutzerimonas kirkiae]TBU92183.1 DUF3298 domain-containing protein [Stutzerimonas kirkiae]TBV01163.1 DUF3298 domain-containing protein [Stutzerimonas kirkiae]TBV10466.1 DUF3298 domain-containing protein [Stutzerimonas kirkiae]TBV13978.1 DUF3298 domain-containing protein [Stutzerimonas kirkiae]